VSPEVVLFAEQNDLVSLIDRFSLLNFQLITDRHSHSARWWFWWQGDEVLRFGCACRCSCEQVRIVLMECIYTVCLSRICFCCIRETNAMTVLMRCWHLPLFIHLINNSRRVTSIGKLVFVSIQTKQKASLYFSN